MRAYDVIRQVAPNARREYLDAFMQGDAVLAEFGVNTNLRLAHFLAQVLHESGGLTVLRENMNYRAQRIVEVFGAGRHSAGITQAEAEKLAGHPQELAERVYGLGNPSKARELGNTQPGDGYRFRGGSLLQSTGRGLYHELSAAFGVDFEGNPDLITAAAHALKPALYFWKTRGINPLADKNDIGGVTRKVNGGTNGLADRKQWFAKVWALLAGGLSPTIATQRDPTIMELQKNLNALNVTEKPISEDGIMGKETENAVRTFQKMNGLREDGDPGPSTQAAVKQRMGATRSDMPPPEPLVTKENVTFASGIAASIMGSVTSGPVQWALAGIMVVAFGVGLWWFLKNRQGLTR